MQAIMETIFETGYLLFAVFCGIFLLIRGKGRAENVLLALAILLLGLGDAFHLIPRMIALNTNGLEAHAAALGVGKLVTSVTMTFFYLLMYVFLIVRERKTPPMWLHVLYGALLVVRIVLVALPQNKWLESSPYIWNVLRNIPFVLMGVIFIVMSFFYCRKDRYFKWMWLLVILSFVFYLITALGATFVPILGLMMLPKTICYMVIFVFALRACLYGAETEKGNSASFCTCTDHTCPLHPTNHDKGCAPCIAKNLKEKEIPSCFFHEVAPDKKEGTYLFEDFARAVMDKKEQE